MTIDKLTPPSPPVSWHTLPPAEAAARLQTDVAQGLTRAEAARRLARYGPNALAEARGRSTLSIFVAQFRSLIVALLVGATAIAFAMGDSVEAAAILVVIVFNAGIGFFTEWKAQQALTALREQAVRTALVIRDGTAGEMPAAGLVPGDLVVLAAGARVPADGRIVESVRLQIEESALTGESHAESKTAERLDDADAAIADRLNMAFLGTSITEGRGRMVVTATGAQTEVGKIGILIDEATDRSSPLEQKLARLGGLLIAIVLALCAVIVVTGWLRGTADFWPMLEIGLSLAIAAVPEGLPAVTTMSLALGMQRMARMRALVRRLPAVETLGSTTVICTDKTGTLTKNEMTVQAFVLDGRRIDVTGTGYASEGAFLEGDTPMDPGSDDLVALALRIGLLCNDARVQRDGDRAAVLGDPTEAALVVAAEKAGMSPDALANDFPRLGEVPFDSASKRMVTVHRAPQGRRLVLVKGSPGTMIATCSAQATAGGVAPMTPADRKGWDEANHRLAGEALRVLALAYRELPEEGAEDDRGDGNRADVDRVASDDSELDASRTDNDHLADVDLARDLIFVGLVGMSDPLRDEAAAAIATCRTAGIRTVMITGDQQPTAAEIARQLGIDRDLDGRALRTVHGRELAQMDAAGWQRAAADAAVFARVSPAHKLRIVEALQQQGHVVAMTGDGVNDAPALKMADIGIAMGIKGTEIAKENADMVITDDNFASIVGAVEQGRIIYGNIVRFIHYLLSCNFSEILTVFLALMLGWPLPMAVLQILWLNLITDVFPAFALALEPSAPDAMKRPPRDPREALLSPGLVARIAWQGLLLAGVTLAAFRIGMVWHGADGEGLRRATTMAFMTLALAQVFHAFSARSQSRSAFTRRLFTNGWLWAAVAICVLLQIAAVYLPLLQRVLHTVPPTARDWGVITACALAPVVVVEVEKGVRRALRRR